jgi:hypothetical protein
LHSTSAEYAFFVSPHGIFTKTGQKTLIKQLHLNNLKQQKIFSQIKFFACFCAMLGVAPSSTHMVEKSSNTELCASHKNGLKRKKQNRKVAGKSPNILRMHNTLKTYKSISNLKIS